MREKNSRNEYLRITRYTIVLCNRIKAYAYKAGLDIAEKIEWLNATTQIESLTRPFNSGSLDVHLDSAFQNIAFAEL